VEGPDSNTSPFTTRRDPERDAAEPAEPAPPAAAVDAAVAAEPRPKRGAALLVLLPAVAILAVAAASGAVIGHALWNHPAQTVTVARPSPPSTFQPGGANGGFGRFGGGSGSVGGTSAGPANADSIAAKVSPALVDINVDFGYEGAAGAGTGIVVRSDGRVLTNNHVINGATRITATDVGNGKTYDATVVGYDPSKDVAVLQLKGASGLATVAIGDSSGVSTGDEVVGVGNAGGVGGTPSNAGGTITALGRSITAADETGSTEQLSGLIQTDANIQPGDSGGPLLDSSGKVIGMNTAGSTGFRFQTAGNAAFAIPIDDVMSTASQITSGKSSATVHIGATALLGVSVETSSGGGFFGGGNTTGVTIGAVVDSGPAAGAGLQAGDVITAIGGTSLDSPDALRSFMLAHHPGDEVQLTWSDGSGGRHTSTITLASGPPA